MFMLIPYININKLIQFVYKILHNSLPINLNTPQCTVLSICVNTYDKYHPESNSSYVKKTENIKSHES